MNAGNLVIKQVSILKVSCSSVDHLLGQYLSQAHVARTDNLSLDSERVEGFTKIVSSPYKSTFDETGFNINDDF